MELYGKKALLDNIDSIEKVDLLNNNRQIIEMLKQKNIKYSFNPKKFVELDKALNHQGIIAYSKNKQIFKTIDEYLKVHADNSLIVILDSILDPRNFGSILRSCEAFGIDCVIYKKDNQAQIDEFVIKTSQGAINNLNLIKVINLSQTLDKLKESGF
jgi:23S rRNA (guanosine2251-2'-O)-methyltransferase